MNTLEQSYELIKILGANGFPSRVVGGAVRNFLLEKPFTDVDIATIAKPIQIESIAAKCGFVYIPLGAKYGSCRVKFNGVLYEITTLREEKNGYADIRFINSFEIDSNRRDFTINAIYADENGNFFDYHDGISDLKNHTVRFIGNPIERIEQDPLRLLRYIRFAALYGDSKIEDIMHEVIISNLHLLKYTQNIKLINELIKILSIDDLDKISHVLCPLFRYLFKVDFSEKKYFSEFTKNSSGKERLYEILCLCSNLEELAEKYGLSVSKIEKYQRVAKLSAENDFFHSKS